MQKELVLKTSKNVNNKKMNKKVSWWYRPCKLGYILRAEVSVLHGF